jgi:GT2 family glycosyltransferase/glycosyltransferase involved in cell wall biosynthesis
MGSVTAWSPPVGTEPLVATVVVTYEGLADTIACVASLLASDYPRHRVVVVDNGSSGEAEALRERFGDDLTTVATGRNLGYGAGANVGIRLALDNGADYIWVLNNDTVVPADTIGRLVAALEADPAIGIASPQIGAPEGPEAPDGVWFAGGLVDLGKGQTRHLTAPLAAGSEPVRSDFLTGCALMVRAGTFRQVGLFWERLFLFWEDTDLDLRVQRQGWTTRVVPDAWIHHSIHGSADRGVVAYYHFRNAILVARRHGGAGIAFRASGHLAIEVGRRWARALLRRCPMPLPETRGLLAGMFLASRGIGEGSADDELACGPQDAVSGAGQTASSSAGVGRNRAAGGPPLRVLHVVRRYSPMLGGTETYVRDLSEAQVRAGRRVVVLTLDHDVTGVMTGRLPPTDRIEGVRVMRLRGIGARRFAIVSRPWQLMREVGRADVIHIHDIRFMTGTTCLTARLRGRRVIVHTHGLIFHTQWAARLKRLLVRVYYGPLLRLTGAAIVASSQPDRDSLLALAPYLTRRVVLLENAIRLEHFLELPRHPVPGRVLAFGRVSRSKGLDRLLQAMADISTPWQIWIAGAEEADERVHLERIAARLGIGERVQLRGPYSNDEFGDLLASADVAAFPSAGEGFGLALLEAMAASVPVVANDIPAHRALVGNELTDTLVDFDSGRAAGEKIAGLLALPEESKTAIGELERHRAAEYDVARLVRDVDLLYESLKVRS